MAILEYARVRAVEQTLDLQRHAFDAASVESVYEETASGKSIGRLELAHCLKPLREGDVVVVWLLERRGQNLKKLMQIVTDLEARGVNSNR
jgi:DNA invertase Pin-like site-specific DNA recombinase